MYESEDGTVMGSTSCPRCGTILHFDDAGQDLSIVCPACNPYPAGEPPPPLPPDMSPEDYWRIIGVELTLLRRGVWLALQREKVSSYRMELHGVLQTADVVIDYLKALRNKLEIVPHGKHG